MPIILSLLTLGVLSLWMAVTNVLGLLFISLILLFETISPRKKPVVSNIPTAHIHLKRVPPEYQKSYSLYLKSLEWHSLRREVLKRDKHRCVDCGIFGKLQVHHLHYDGVDTMTFTADQCVSVCHDCHAKRHGRDRV